MNLNLEPVLATLASDRNLIALAQNDKGGVNKSVGDYSYWGSRWMVMARSVEPLERLASDSRWRRVAASGARRAWTDDYSNILSVFMP